MYVIFFINSRRFNFLCILIFSVMDVGHLKFVVEATRLYITILDGRVQPTLALDELSFNGGLNGKNICTINGRFSIAMLPEDMLMAEDVHADDHR